MEGILIADEACRYLKMSKVTLYRYVRQGSIPAFKVGREWKFDKNTLDTWIQQRVKQDTEERSVRSAEKEHILQNTGKKGKIP